MRLIVGESLCWREVWHTVSSPRTVSVAVIVFVAATAAGLLAWRSERKKTPHRVYHVGLIAGLYLAFCPNLLLALTPKYQQWHGDGCLVYTSTHLSLYGTSLLLLSLFLLLLRVPRFRFALLAIAACALAFGFSLGEHTNRSVEHKQRNHIALWRLAKAWMDSESFRCLPKEVTISMPVEYPFWTTPPLSDGDYFCRYLSVKSGKTVSIHYVSIEQGLFDELVFYTPFMAKGDYAGYLAITTDSTGQRTAELCNVSPWRLSRDEIYFLSRNGERLRAEDYLRPIGPRIPPGRHTFVPIETSEGVLRERPVSFTEEEGNARHGFRWSNCQSPEIPMIATALGSMENSSVASRAVQ